MALVNPQLKPERSVDLTLNNFGKDWGFEASVYYRNCISDAILSHNIDADTIQNQNSGRVDYTGLDAGVKGKVFDMLDVGLSYGLIHADVAQRHRQNNRFADANPHRMDDAETVDPLSITLSEEARSSSYSNSDGSQKAAGFAITHLRADYAIVTGLASTLRSITCSIHNTCTAKDLSKKAVITGLGLSTSSDLAI